MNDTNIKKKKSSKQKRVLIASIVLAGVIMVGSTFAWFTSKDEVTNKLTASSNYGVSIVEDFTPPSNWVPGQEVNKEVRVTNTGNIDTFVKVSLGNFIDITYETTDGTALPDTIGDTPTTVGNLIELSQSLGSSDEPDTQAKSKDEVKSIQAGGRLIYGKVDGMPDFGVVPYENDTLVGTAFTPTETGLYIFERDVDNDTSGNTTTRTYEYSGYYFVADISGTGGKYYAITIPSAAIIREDVDYTDVKVANVTTSDIKLRTTKKVEGADLTFSEIKTDNTTTPNSYYILATYYGENESSDNNTNTKNDVAIRIYLADTDYDSNGVSTNWTYHLTGTNSDIPTFYLNQILTGGETSEKLIDHLELDSTVTEKAYINFDYNLKLTANSVQVVYDSNGNITANVNPTAEGVNAEWSSDPAKVTAITRDTIKYTVTWDF
ncbi:MAG: BsaA family SipW-dependent biofilm matrix protein [Oscillospiraceae bacterium]